MSAHGAVAGARPVTPILHGIVSDQLATPPAFHSLVRWHLMSTLRTQHPQLYADCQRTMAMYYAERISAATEQGNDSSTKKGLFGWLRGDTKSKEQERERVVSLGDKADVADDVFSTIVEYLYHALQVQEWQEAAFAQWRLLVERMKEEGYYLRIGQLWEVVRQLVAEDEPFFQKNSAAQEINAYSKPQPGNASQPAQDDGVEFLRLFHVRHVMGLGNRHSPGTHDISFEFVRMLKQLRIIFGPENNQRWHVNF
jgi:hypothetical protein